MKRLMLLAALPAALLAAPAQAEEEVLTIINRTGYDINEVYVAPSHSDNWEEDIMDVDILPDGERVNIDMSRSEDTCDWDVRVVYSDGTPAIWTGVDLCEISQLSLFYSHKEDKTWFRAQ